MRILLFCCISMSCSHIFRLQVLQLSIDVVPCIRHLNWIQADNLEQRRQAKDRNSPARDAPNRTLVEMQLVANQQTAPKQTQHTTKAILKWSTTWTLLYFEASWRQALLFPANLVLIFPSKCKLNSSVTLCVALFFLVLNNLKGN